MVKIPTERRYEEYIESYLTSLVDDGLHFTSRIHKTTDGWYDKNLCLVGDDFIQFLKETQKDTYDTLLKKYGENTDKKNMVEILIEKHRNGPTGMVELFFDDKKTSFLSVEKSEFGDFVMPSMNVPEF